MPSATICTRCGTPIVNGMCPKCGFRAILLLVLSAIIVVMFFTPLLPIARAEGYHPPPTPPPVYHISENPGCFSLPKSEKVVTSSSHVLLAVVSVETCFGVAPAGIGIAYINFLRADGANLIKGKSFEVLDPYAPIEAWLIQAKGREYLITITFASQGGVWYINSVIVS